MTDSSWGRNAEYVAGPIDASGPGEPSPDDLEALASHDPTGIELAQSIAQQTASITGVQLPPPRGTTRRRRRRAGSPGVQFSGSGPDPRDPQTVGDVLGRLIRDRGWTKQISVRVLLARWPELVGSTNAAHSTPEGYQDGVLTIRTESTTWATSLRSLAPNLVAQLNGELGEGTVTRVVVLGPQAPSWKHGPRSVRGRGPRDTYG